MIEKDIYEFTQQQEIAYNTIPVTVTENYEWSMLRHINTTVLYKNSKYTTGNREDKPFKNIIRPILNFQYRAEGFDLKDIVLFVNSNDQYFKSFLVSKYHEKWARKYNIDSFIDQLVETYIDFGGVLLKNVYKERPQVVKWQSVAFCDQTNVMSGPIGIKHYFSTSELLKMKKRHWGDEKFGATISIDDLITMAKQEKTSNRTTITRNKTPGNYLEIYEVHGDFPDDWLYDYGQQNQGQYPTNKETGEKDIEYTRQMHIVVLVKKPNGEKAGETLFCGPEDEGLFKFLPRDEIYNRALGLGGAEELFEPQVWVNLDVIRLKGMLDAASKILYKTTDPAVANRNKTDQMENGEIIILADGTDIGQLNTTPVNLDAFMKSMADWQNHAQQMGGANDVALGKNPPSGTPFDLQQLVTQEGQSLHEYRKGKLANFLDEVYRDWIIPYISKELTKDQEFMSDIDLDQLQGIADNLVIIETNNMMREKVLTGQNVDPQEKQQYEQMVRQSFLKGGSKKFLKILGGELKDAPIDVMTNIAGHEKDLNAMTDKLVNVFKQILSNPTVLDDPRAAKIFNRILEYSGISPIDFYTPTQPQAADNNQPKNQVSQSINYKDLPPEGQQQMAAEAGIKISSSAPPSLSGGGGRVPARKPYAVTVT